MAVELIETEDQKEKKEKPFEQPAPSQSGGPALNLPSVSSPSQRVKSTQPATPAKGTGFTGVGRYLQANVGSRLGQQVAGQVAKAGQQARSQLGQAVTQFGTGLSAQQDEFNKQKAAAQEALKRISSGELTNVSPEQQAAYARIAQGGFSSPIDLQPIQGARAQAELAGKLGAATETSKGRQGLLQQAVGRGSTQYAGGKAALDALILGQSGRDLASARGASAGLTRRVDVEEALAAEKARQFGTEVQRAQGLLTGERTGLEKGIQGAIGEQKAEYGTQLDKIYSKLQEELSKGEISKDTAQIMRTLGIEPQALNVYGLNLDQFKTLFAKKPASEITAASSATLEQLRKINALRSLGGQSPLFSSEELQKAGTTTDPLSGLSYKTEDFKVLQDAQRDAIKRATESFMANLPLPIRGVNEGSEWFAEKEGAPSAFQYSPGRGETRINTDLFKQAQKLFDPTTGKIDVGTANQLIDFWRGRRQYLGREGWFGAGKYGEYAGDAERIAALQQMLSDTQKTLRIKDE